MKLHHLIRAGLLALAIVLLTACAPKPPVNVTLSNPTYGSGTFISVDVKAMVDNVRITDVTVNRDNCPWMTSKEMKPPVDVVFGKVVSYLVASCAITEVAVVTDKGSFTFTFK